MSSQKEYSMLFSLNASLNSGFQQTFGKASSSLQDMQKKIQALAKEQADITAYEKQQKAVESTKTKLEVLKQQYDNIQKEISETGTYSSALENKLLSKQQQISKTTAAMDAQNVKLREMGSALQAAGVDTSHLSEESKRLEGEMKDIKEAQEKAADSAKEYGETSSNAFEAISSALVSAGIAKALKEIAGAYKECIVSSADFEQAMSQVAATMGVSKESISELSEFAKKMGAETSFSAVEAAEGLNILAMSGLSAAEQISALPQVLDLAAAGSMDMATAAKYVTGSVKGFSDSMENAGYYADLMAKGATMANTDVSGLGAALSSTAATATSYGQAADSVTLSLLRLAEQNITGEEAATKLNRAMADLYTPTKEAKAALDGLGISCYDFATGDARDFNDIVDEMSAALSGMSQEQANTLKNTIFTTNGLNAFNKMTVSTTETVNKFWNGISNAKGSAASQAQTQLDNLNGSLTILSSAMEGLRIAVGDEFSEEIQGLVNMGTDLVSEITAFVKANPALIKGVTAFVGVLGTATAGILAAKAATIAFGAVKAMLIPGVGPFIAATAAIAGMTAGIVSLTASTERNIPSVKELTEEATGLTEAISNAGTSFSDTMADTEATVSVANHYIDVLEEMQNAGLDSAESQKEYRNVLQLLAEAMPELADSIDLTTEGWIADTEALRKNTEEFKENAKAKAQQEYINAIQEEYNDVLKERYKNEVRLTEATIRKEAADKKLAEASQALDAIFEKAHKEEEDRIEQYGEAIDATWKYENEINEARKVQAEYGNEQAEAERLVEQYTAAIEKDSEAVAAAEEAMRNAEAAIASMTETTVKASDAEIQLGADFETVSLSIESVYENLSDLAEQYEEAYKQAKSSLEGQYGLWDDVAQVSDITVGTMGEKILKQTKYWQEYNTNLESLRDRAGDIEGLAQVIGSFADGSEESVNAVSGMAKASDEDLRAMVDSYQELQKAQGSASENIAALSTEFDSKTHEIADSVSQMVNDMDLSGEAAAAARETLQGYISGAESMKEDVRKAFEGVGASARIALYGKQGTVHVPAYASGTEAAEPGLALVGEKGPELVSFRGGESVTTAAKTERILESQSMDGSMQISQNISITVEGGATEETMSQIRNAAEEFKEAVEEAMNEIETDRKRRAYT